MELARNPQAVFRGILVGAVVVVLLALWGTLGGWDGLTAVLIAAILLLLAGLAAELYVLRRTRPAPAAAAAARNAAPAPATGMERKLTIRCKACGQVFTIVDDGRRPLVHACPSCGKSGKLAERPAA